MSDKSAIEWTDATWNPILARNIKTGKVGWHCEHATTGCEFCYAEGFNKRLGTGLPFKAGHRKDIEIFLDEEMLTVPLRWKKPRMIFVGSMTDLFANFVTDDNLDKILAVMALTPQHTYQVVTKRAERMRRYLTNADHLDAMRDGIRSHGFTVVQRVQGLCADYLKFGKFQINGFGPLYPDDWARAKPHLRTMPLTNVWFGVSAERQEEADERIPLLLQTPAAKRFISAEPLLGPIDLNRIHEHGETRGGGCWDSWESSITGKRFDIWAGDDEDPMSPGHPKLDWVIAGGESGPKARPMHPDWARSLRDQCTAAGVAFFFKQWGEWAPSTPEQAAGNPRSGWQALRAHPCVAKAEELYPDAGAAFVERVGKKAAGRLLDGVEHNGFPKVPA